MNSSRLGYQGEPRHKSISHFGMPGAVSKHSLIGIGGILPPFAHYLRRLEAAVTGF